MSAWRKIDVTTNLLARVFIAGVFGFAAWMKLRNPAAVQSFTESILAFDVLERGAHDHLVVLGTFAVPWVEALCAALLLVGLWTRAAAFVMLAALGVFLWAISEVLAGGKAVECGCLGDFSFPCGATINECHLWRNGVLGAVCLYLVGRGGGRGSLDFLLHRPKRPGPGGGTHDAPTSDRATPAGKSQTPQVRQPQWQVSDAKPAKAEPAGDLPLADRPAGGVSSQLPSGPEDRPDRPGGQGVGV